MLLTATAGSGPDRMRGSDGPRPMARKADLSGGAGRERKRTIQPSVFCGFHAGRSGLHEVLRVEVRTGRVGRAGGMHDGEMSLVPEGLQR